MWIWLFVTENQTGSLYTMKFVFYYAHVHFELYGVQFLGGDNIFVRSYLTKFNSTIFFFTFAVFIMMQQLQIIQMMSQLAAR